MLSVHAQEVALVTLFFLGGDAVCSDCHQTCYYVRTHIEMLGPQICTIVR